MNTLFQDKSEPVLNPLFDTDHCVSVFVAYSTHNSNFHFAWLILCTLASFSQIFHLLIKFLAKPFILTHIFSSLGLFCAYLTVFLKYFISSVNFSAHSLSAACLHSQRRIKKWVLSCLERISSVLPILLLTILFVPSQLFWTAGLRRKLYLFQVDTCFPFFSILAITLLCLLPSAIVAYCGIVACWYCVIVAVLHAGMSITLLLLLHLPGLSAQQQFKTSPHALWSRCCLHAKKHTQATLFYRMIFVCLPKIISISSFTPPPLNKRPVLSCLIISVLLFTLLSTESQRVLSTLPPDGSQHHPISANISLTFSHWQLTW